MWKSIFVLWSFRTHYSLVDNAINLYSHKHKNAFFLKKQQKLVNTASSYEYDIHDHPSPPKPLLKFIGDIQNTNYNQFHKYYKQSVQKFHEDDSHYIYDLSKALFYLSNACIPHNSVNMYDFKHDSSLTRFEKSGEMHLETLEDEMAANPKSSHDVEQCKNTDELFLHGSKLAWMFSFVCSDKTSDEDLCKVSLICLSNCYYILMQCLHLFFLDTHL